MNRETFQKRIDGIYDLPTLPQVAVKLNRMLDNQDVTVKDVAEIIEKDQAIVPKLLRLVNSSFFGLGKKISSIPRAVVVLGFNTVRNALVSVAIIDSLKMIQCGLIDFVAFWRHAISCAVISRYLAERFEVETPEDAFTAGLIHDMGKLVLARYFPDEFVQIMEEVGKGKTFYEAESDILPMHHNQIGAYLTERWRLASTITEAIRYSHGAYDLEARQLACTVSCAEIILGMRSEEARPLPIEWPRCRIADKLRIELESFKELSPDIKSEIESACILLMGETANG